VETTEGRRQKAEGKEEKMETGSGKPDTRQQILVTIDQ
jgi:hypothetical protein